MRFALSLEYVSVSNPLCTRTCATPSIGFGPSSRQPPRESTYGELPSSHLAPFTAFLPLSTVYSSLSLLGLFHPKATSKIGFPRVFPRYQASTTLRRFTSCPLGITGVRLPQSYPHDANFPRRTFKALFLIAIRSNHRWG